MSKHLLKGEPASLSGVIAARMDLKRHGSWSTILATGDDSNKHAVDTTDDAHPNIMSSVLAQSSLLAKKHP